MTDLEEIQTRERARASIKESCLTSPEIDFSFSLCKPNFEGFYVRNLIQEDESTVCRVKCDEDGRVIRWSHSISIPYVCACEYRKDKTPKTLISCMEEQVGASIGLLQMFDGLKEIGG